MKRTALRLMRRCGVFASFREMNKDKALIVTYHRFSRTEDGRSTSATALVEQLAFLKRHYSVVKLSEIKESITLRKPLPPRTAVVTIDDGFCDAYEIAFPILRQIQIPATLFVITDFLDGRIWLWTDKLRYLTANARSGRVRVNITSNDLTFNLDGPLSRLAAASKVNEILKKLPESVKDSAIQEIAASLKVSLPNEPPPEFGPITWAQAIEMDRANIEIGSHTLTHPILPNVGNEQLDRELSGSRARLEQALEHQVKLFCYPNGSYDARTKRAVAKAGYECAATTEPRLVEKESDPLALSRIPADLDFDHFAQNTSGFEYLKNRLLRFGRA